MAGIQGAVMLANAMQNPQIISDETERLVAWLETLPNRKIQLGKVGVRSPDSNAA
jgi:hypothetical protein